MAPLLASHLLLIYLPHFSQKFSCFIITILKQRVTAKVENNVKTFVPATLCKLLTPSAPITLASHFLQTWTFIHNQKTTIEIRYWTLIYYYHLILQPHSHATSCHHTIFYGHKTQPRTIRCVQFSFLFYLLWPGRIPQSFLDFKTVTHLKIAGQLFYRMPSIWVCLIVPHNWIQAIFTFVRKI